MITINISKTNINPNKFIAECPLCGNKLILQTITMPYDKYGYWSSGHQTDSTKCSRSWQTDLYEQLERNYISPYGDTDDGHNKFSDEQITEIRNGIELAINKLYEANKCLYVMEMF